MASIERRESGWRAKIRRQGFPSQSKTFQRRADAEAWIRQVENEMDRGLFVSRSGAEKTTFFAALARYSSEISSQKKGHAQELSRIIAWQQTKLAYRSLASLRPADFAEYRDQRLRAGAAAATVRNDLAVVSHLFRTAATEWSIPIQNPVANIRLPTANNARTRRLVQDEETRLLAAIDAAESSGGGSRTNIWTRPAMILAIETAMRQGELLALLWENIDLRSQVAHLPETKNGEWRDVPLSKRALATLESLPSRASAGRVLPISASALDQSWRRCVARARRKLEAELELQGQATGQDLRLLDLTWHDLRHEATTRLAEKLQMHELMKVTGHKDARMLARYYHPSAEALAKKLG